MMSQILRCLVFVFSAILWVSVLFRLWFVILDAIGYYLVVVDVTGVYGHYFVLYVVFLFVLFCWMLWCC